MLQLTIKLQVKVELNQVKKRTAQVKLCNNTEANFFFVITGEDQDDDAGEITPLVPLCTEGTLILVSYNNRMQGIVG